jgi:chromosome segregation ATPase
MRAFMVIVLLLAVGIGVTGYALGWFTVTGDLEKVKKGREAVVALFDSTRADFQKQAETRLKAMDLNLDELKAKAKNGRAVTKEQMNEAIANLNKKTEAAREELRELKTATPERWEALKTHLNTSLEELETGFEDTFSRFMSEWTHSGRERTTVFLQGFCT